MNQAKDALDWLQSCTNFYMVSYILSRRLYEKFNLHLNCKIYQILALGFYHMQSAYDRDNFVTIHWENITPGMEHNFNKYNSSEVTHYNTTYDYDSVMHYGAFGFSKNGNATIVPTVNEICFKQNLFEILICFSILKDGDTGKIGQRTGLSQKDIWKLNLMYECENTIDQPEI